MFSLRWSIHFFIRAVTDLNGCKTPDCLLGSGKVQKWEEKTHRGAGKSALEKGQLAPGRREDDGAPVCQGLAQRGTLPGSKGTLQMSSGSGGRRSGPEGWSAALAVTLTPCATWQEPLSLPLPPLHPPQGRARP